jgi:hypothetical protein
MTFEEEHAIETFKSLITISVEGQKILLLINGGAVVALLAFLGQSTLGPGLAPKFWLPMAFFVGGVWLCALAFVGSYFTQFALFNECFPKRVYRGPNHMTCFKATVALALCSVALFGLGAFFSVSVFANSEPVAGASSSSPTQQPAAPKPVSAAASSIGRAN